MERSTIFHGKIHYFDWAIFNSYVKLPEGTIDRMVEDSFGIVIIHADSQDRLENSTCLPGHDSICWYVEGGVELPTTFYLLIDHCFAAKSWTSLHSHYVIIVNLTYTILNLTYYALSLLGTKVLVYPLVIVELFCWVLEGFRGKFGGWMHDFGLMTGNLCKCGRV